MILAVSAPAGLALAVWLYLILLRGGFWRADQRLGDGSVEPLRDWPEIVVVVPARDEAAVIGETIRSLLAQDYPRPVRIVVVDDGSRDGTAAAARDAAGAQGARLAVVEGVPVPAGWAGKVRAMAQGVAEAGRIAPEARYILFSDADIAHDPENLRRLVVRAERSGAHLVSIMVMLAVNTVWERLLIPPFIFFFQMLYPFAQVNRGRCYAAAGGCMLVRRNALESAGGLESIRDALIDDCALARCIGESGGRLWLGLSERTRSTRPYGGLAGVWNMVARTAFTQLDYSPLWLAGTVPAMLLTYVVPPAVLLGYPFHGDPVAAGLGFAALILMIAAYWPTVRLYRQSFAVAMFLPAAAALYTAMTVDSAWRHWRGAGGGWKGRVYPRTGRRREGCE